MNNKSPNTTQIYTHVSTEQLGKIIQTLWSAPVASPLDKLKLNK
jgi:site-specific recombinase XerD